MRKFKLAHITKDHQLPVEWDKLKRYIKSALTYLNVYELIEINGDIDYKRLMKYSRLFPRKNKKVLGRLYGFKRVDDYKAIIVRLR